MELGRFELFASEAPGDLHPDCDALLKGSNDQLLELAAALQLHPVMDPQVSEGTSWASHHTPLVRQPALHISDAEIGQLLVDRGGVESWLRIATLCGRVRNCELVCGTTIAIDESLRVRQPKQNFRASSGANASCFAIHEDRHHASTAWKTCGAKFDFPWGSASLLVN